MSDKLREAVEDAPETTGVYILKNKRGRSVYIGKANNLRSRLRSYFGESESIQRPHVGYLMREVSDLDYVVTNDEREALLLENSLIKQQKPRYNIRLKDDKNYLSLRLDPKETFPKLRYTRKVVKDGALYYGPFASADALRKAKRLMHKVFPLRDCTEAKFRRHSSRPCLNYNMGLCLGPCAGKVDEEKYGEVVQQTRMFLRGEKTGIIKLLKDNMHRASEETRYEDAAHYRDQIALLERNLDNQMFITPGANDMDIFGFYREAESVEFAVLFHRGGTIIERADYSFLKTVGSDREIMGEFVSQFYAGGGDRFIPNEIVVPFDFDGKGVFRQWLSEKRGKKIAVTMPTRGKKLKLAGLARDNAEESFRRKYAERSADEKQLGAIRKALKLKKMPKTVECFDISNTQGTQAVASAVRFVDGKPDKSRYRRYKIKTIKGSNDYAMMYEVLSRRLQRVGEENWDPPDLVLIDGGRGQLNVAYRVLSELGFEKEIALASIAKGRGIKGYGEDKPDKIYVHRGEEGKNTPIPLETAEELYLLMRIRDEAHRFAITYHKRLRGKKALRSELDYVPGIGKKRKTTLLRYFGSISKLKNASVEEIASVPGFSIKIAEELKLHLS